MFPALAVSAVLPSALLVWFFHKKDANPEPARVLWATFGLGVLTIPFVLLVVWPIDLLFGVDAIQEPVAAGLAQAFLHAAIPEEGLKLCVLLLYTFRHREFDEPMDGVVYGAVASLGFATLENVLYVASGGLGTAVLRALTAVPSHAFLGAIMGFYVGQAKFRSADRAKLLVLAWVVPMLLHGLYDFPLLAMGKYQETAVEGAAVPTLLSALVPLALVALLVEWWLVKRIVTRLRKVQLAEHAVARGQDPKFGYERPSSSRALVGWVLTVSGAMLATLGGLLVTLLATVLLFTDDAATPDGIGATVGMLVAGIITLGLGFWVFAGGRDRLHRHKLTLRGLPLSRR